jgi:hypothetical protein
MSDNNENKATRKKKTKEEKAIEKANKTPINSLSDIKVLNDIEFDFIVAYVKSQGQADIDWLKSVASKELTDKNDKPRKISFIEIRIEFAKKYRPDILNTKEKKQSMYDLIDAL